MVLRPTAIDLDGDDLFEVLMPYVRDDSLFVRIVDREGRDLYPNSLFLASGEPRLDDNGEELPWMTGAPQFYMEDVDGGTGELVSVISSGFAGVPRGVLVHSLLDGTWGILERHRILWPCVRGLRRGWCS